MGFAIWPVLHDLAAHSMDKATNSVVLAGKIQIGCTHATLFGSDQPIQKQRRAIPLALIGIFDRDTDFSVTISAFENLQITDDTAFGFDAQNDIGAGPIRDVLE